MNYPHKITHIHFWLISLYLLAPLSASLAQIKPTAFTLTQPFEKTYLQTDRDYYVAGDTLWLAAYLLNATDHTPQTASKTLYVQLLDATGRTKASPILHIDSTGHAATAITLADSLPAGLYQLLAYTNWMRNSDNDFLFRKRIYIEAANQPATPINLSSTGLRLQLFPEGGHLVVGLASRVAFEARDQQGHSLSIQGVLLNEQGDTLTDFRSLHLGMGTFSLTPQAHGHYRAIAITPDGRSTSIELPDALPTGYQLAADNLTHTNQVRVVIQASQPQPGRLLLFAHVRGRICYEAQLDAARRATEVRISYDSIPQDGILHLTLFDTHTQPVAERLVFINRQNQLRIHIQTDRTRYQPHQPVSLAISVTDPSGQPVATQLALAITDRRQALELAPYQATLRSYLLLSSDLKGTIEEPEYYFDSTQVHARQYLDYVMMTHGWRRFSWRAMLSDSTTQPVYKPETGLTIAGQVRYGDDKKLAREAALTGMLRANGQLLPLTATTDKEGRLAIANLLFADTATLVLRQRTNRPIQFALDTRSLPAFVQLPEAALGQVAERQALVNQAVEMQALIKQLLTNGGRLLQAVDVKARRLDASRTDARRQAYGVPEQTITITEQMALGKNSARQLLMYVPGRYKHPVLMVDGVPVTGVGIETLSANDVAAVDLAYAAWGDSDGVYNFLTKRGADAGKRLNQVLTPVVGYAVSREFYSPDYARPVSEPRLVDYRATLYWNPALQTDAKGQAKVVFYNTDQPTTIQIVAEGISRRGQPGYGQVQYRVEPK